MFWGKDKEPFIIAELSANHNGSIERAFESIKVAKDCGASAIKIQTYTADTMTIKSDRDEFKVKSGIWSGYELYDLYNEAHTPYEWHKPLFDYAKDIGITIFSSPFDNTAVDLLEDLNTPAYKIASFEATDLPLIKYVAQTGKPIIISTGMASAEEIQQAIDAAREGGCKDLAILHCVSGYPALSSDYNLNTMVDMQRRFGLVTGLSDHTIDNTTAIAGVAMGASIIEKHVTLNRNGGGPDDSFSLEFNDLKKLVIETKAAWNCLGLIDYSVKSSEQNNVKFRRSLYCVKNLKKGEIITHHHVRSIRPGFGLAPKYLDKVLKSKAKCNIARGTPITMELID